MSFLAVVGAECVQNIVLDYFVCPFDFPVSQFLQEGIVRRWWDLQTDFYDATFLMLHHCSNDRNLISWICTLPYIKAHVPYWPPTFVSKEVLNVFWPQWRQRIEEVLWCTLVNEGSSLQTYVFSQCSESEAWQVLHKAVEYEHREALAFLLRDYPWVLDFCERNCKRKFFKFLKDCSIHVGKVPHRTYYTPKQRLAFAKQRKSDNNNNNTTKPRCLWCFR